MKKRFLSILLVLVIVLAMLPTAVFAEDPDYPDHVTLCNQNSGTIWLYSGYCLQSNTSSGTVAYSEGTEYVARYDGKKLYLNDYHGAAETSNTIQRCIYVDSAKHGIEIVVEKDSSISIKNTSTGSTAYAEGIYSQQELTISGSGKLTISTSSAGNPSNYGFMADGIITYGTLIVTAPLEITAEATGEKGEPCGICVYQGAVNLSGGNKSITTKGNTGWAIDCWPLFGAEDSGDINVSCKLDINIQKDGYGLESRYTSDNKTGKIMLEEAELTITGVAAGGIHNGSSYSAGAGVSIIDSTVKINFTGDGYVNGGIRSASSDVKISNSDVDITAPGYAINTGISIKDSTVNLTNSSGSGVINGKADIDLSTSGSVTVRSSENTTDNLISGTVTLGQKTRNKNTASTGNQAGTYDETQKATILAFEHYEPNPITETLVSVTDLTKTYTGSALEPTISSDLTKGTDYSVAYAVKEGCDGSLDTAGKPLGAGTYVVTVTGLGTYGGSFTKEFVIQKAAQSAPTVDYTSPTTVNGKGRITGTTTAMEYRAADAGDEDPWTACTAESTEVEAGKTYLVRYAADGNHNASAVASVTVYIRIAVPTAASDLVYNGSTQTALPLDAAYTLSGTYSATNAAAYTATVTLKDGYMWSDGTTDPKDISWSIAKKDLTKDDLRVTLPASPTYDGTAKSASAVLRDALSGAGNLTVSYQKNTEAVSEAIGAGTYTCLVSAEGGQNFNAASGLTDETWTFTISPADYTYTVPAGQAYTVGKGLGAITVLPEAADGVNGEKVTGTTEWYTDAACTNAAKDADLANVPANEEKTLYWKFTPSAGQGNYVTDVKTGRTVFAAVPKTDLTERMDLSRLTIADQTYNGKAASYTGSAAVTGHEDLDSTLVYAWYTAENEALGEAPKNAGSYYLKISIPDENVDYCGSKTVPFTIFPTAVTVKPESYTIRAGSSIPDFVLVYSGLAEGEETVDTAFVPVIRCYEADGTTEVSKSTKAGTYTITLTNGAEIQNANYKVTVETGTLTIRNASSGKTTKPQTNAPASGSAADRFDDVKNSDWFCEDVEYVYAAGLMNGISASDFGPYLYITRGMIVTILYRMEGQPKVDGACAFTDVKSGMYYERAITWAAANGVVDGYGNGKFGPEDEITRQQLAAILWRYARLKGYDVSTGKETEIAGIEEADAYAVPALQWACSTSLLEGVCGRICPANKATRCQAAAILHRFCENIVR